MSRISLAAAAGIVLAASAASAAPSGAPAVSATHTLVKLQPTDDPPPDKAAKIAAASNEMEGFQAVVSGGSSGVSRVSARISDLKGPKTIPASNVVLYREGYMQIRQLSDDNGMRGQVPDALVPDVDPFVGEKRNAFPFDVPAGELRTIWVDVHVPMGTPAGKYRGSLEVTGSGFESTLPVELEVFGFELPSTPSYATAFGLTWNGTCQAHFGDAWCSGDDEKFDRLRQLYGIAGLDNRVSFSKVAGAPVPGSGGNLDFARYDRAYGPLLDGSAKTRLAGAALRTVEVWQRDPDASDYGAWARHFKDKGWFNKLFDYTCDEPPLTCAWSDIGPRQAKAHAGDSEFKSLVTTTVAHLRENGLYESTDVIVPVVNFVEGKNGEYAGDQTAEYRQAAKDGKTVWVYSSCMSHGCGNTVDGEYGGDPDLAGWPSLVIDHTALRNRAMPWVAYRFGFTGELYWDSAYAFVTKGDPWNDQYEFTGNGDGTLFYPGRPDKIGGSTHIPVESIRLKQERDGVEDYEYLAILDAFDRGAAQAAAKKLFPHAWSAGDISPDQLLA
ncbi:MAG TPA: glycoside hydrolase domain-containing protein, partial [Vulgatibacter sp.]